MHGSYLLQKKMCDLCVAVEEANVVGEIINLERTVSDLWNVLCEDAVYISDTIYMYVQPLMPSPWCKIAERSCITMKNISETL